eukprot:scaffold15122_cov75-Skeletonema_marinoi.AAC.2
MAVSEQPPNCGLIRYLTATHLRGVYRSYSWQFLLGIIIHIQQPATPSSRNTIHGPYGAAALTSRRKENFGSSMKIFQKILQPICYLPMKNFDWRQRLDVNWTH